MTARKEESTDDIVEIKICLEVIDQDVFHLDPGMYGRCPGGGVLHVLDS